jgi:hypothetical protein
MCSRTYSKVRVKQSPQKVQESLEKPVQEDSQSVEDSLTESSATEHASPNGNQSDMQHVCRGPMADVGDTAIDGTEPSEMCDMGSDQGNTDECEDVELTPNESYTVATDTWENLPNQVCRLCASTDEHPKQSIVGWLSMLNEIIPDLVSYLFLVNYLFGPFLNTEICVGDMNFLTLRHMSRHKFSVWQSLSYSDIHSFQAREV